MKAPSKSKKKVIKWAFATMLASHVEELRNYKSKRKQNPPAPKEQMGY
jgi:hypothetical protein